MRNSTGTSSSRDSITTKPKVITTKPKQNPRPAGDSSYVSTANFRGACSGMDGHVFQVTGEQSKKGQFHETMDRMKVYTSTITNKDTSDLNILFTDLKEPVPDRPDKPQDTVEDVGTITKADSFDRDVYVEEVKQYRT